MKRVDERIPARHRVKVVLATWLSILVAGGGLAFTESVASTGAAGAANSGTEICESGGNVEGVWVTVDGGTSGWAKWAGAYGGSDPAYATWSYNTQGKSYRLTVGCGGKPSNWASSVTTPNYGHYVNVDCFPGWSYGEGSVDAHNKCYSA